MSRLSDRLPRRIREFARDTSGVTAIEYALIAAGISLAIVITVSLLGDELSAFFGDLGASLAIK